MNAEFVEKLLKLVAEHEANDELIWHSNLDFYILCNDIFAWGCADGEDVTPESLPVLEQALKDATFPDGPLLYCARMRNMRPQGAAYTFIQKENWPLFDACGPEREVGLGNPYKPGEYVPASQRKE